MGFDKSLLLADPEGRPLLAALAEQLAGHFSEIMLVADDKAKLARQADLAVFTILEDLYPRSGPLGAIITALAASGNAPVFITGCDMPFIDWPTIDRLQALLEQSGADAVIPRSGQHLEPLCAFYGPKAAPIFQQALNTGNLSIRDNLRQLNTAYLDLNLNKDESSLFKNLNRLEDIQVEGLPIIGAASFSALHYENGQISQRSELTIAERAVEISVNGTPWLSVMATPQYLDDLAAGLLFGEGVIESFDDVAEIKVRQNIVDVTLSDPNATLPLDRVVRLSGFGAGLSALHCPSDEIRPDTGPQIKAEYICELMDEFNRYSGLFQKTGGVHGVRFIKPGQTDIFFDDVGRHNALDKVIGRLLRLKQGTSEGLILTTGRISVEILLKTHKAGIRMLISRSAPTDRGVELARQLGLTLVGFARGRSFNIYAGEERIIAS